MHHQVRVRQTSVDLLDNAHDQDVTGGPLGELVGAVACADCDRKSVDLGCGNEFLSLRRIGQMLLGLFLGQPGTMAILDAAIWPIIPVNSESLAVAGAECIR